MPADLRLAADADPSVADEVGSWLLGTGLHVAAIVVGAVVTLLVLRLVIRKVTDHIAEGAPFGSGIARSSGEGGSALRERLGALASARRAQRARTIGSVLRSTATLVVGSLAVLLVLDEVGLNIAPFIASAGIVGVALGFGAQSLVKDFLSGVFMLLEDQYGVGDVVDVGPAVGTVEEVGLRVTRLRDAAGTLWYVPNGAMVRVGNKTQGWAKAVVEVKVDYFVDLDEVRELLRHAAAQVAADPVVGTYVHDEPSITGIEDLTFDAVTLRVSVRTAPAMQWEVARALRVAVRDTLTTAGVPLGGQRDLMAADRAERAERARAAEVGPTATVTTPETGAETGTEPDPAETGEDRPAPEGVTTRQSAEG